MTPKVIAKPKPVNKRMPTILMPLSSWLAKATILKPPTVNFFIKFLSYLCITLLNSEAVLIPTNSAQCPLLHLTFNSLCGDLATPWIWCKGDNWDNQAILKSQMFFVSWSYPIIVRFYRQFCTYFIHIKNSRYFLSLSS